jgi:hypothetical protein
MANGFTLGGRTLVEPPPRLVVLAVATRSPESLAKGARRRVYDQQRSLGANLPTPCLPINTGIRT